MAGKWHTHDKSVFVEKMRKPFQSTPAPSLQSSLSKERESAVETLMSRVTPQILESHERGLTWDTPEEWDRNFDLLGGGQSRRRSSRILSRMDWDKFVELSYKIIESRD